MDTGKRRRAIWWWSAAAALLLIVAGVGTCILAEKNRADKQAGEHISSSQDAGMKASPAESKEKTSGSIGAAPETAGQNPTAGNHAAPEAMPAPRTATQRPVPAPAQVLPRTADANPARQTADAELTAEKTVRTLITQSPFGIREVLLPAAEIKDPGKIASLAPGDYHPVYGRWLLGFGVSQNQSGIGYAIHPQYREYVHKNYLTRMGEGESSLGAVQAGLFAGYRLGHNFSLISGLQYLQRNTRQQFNFSDEVPVTMMPGNKPDKFGNYPIIGYFSPSGTTSYQGFTRLTVFEIPIGLMYDWKLRGGKWVVSPAVSVNTGFVVSETGSTLDYQQLSVVQRQPDWFRKTTLSGNGALGLYRQLGHNMRIGAVMSAAYTATPVYVPGATVRPRAWATGLGTQLIWRID